VLPFRRFIVTFLAVSVASLGVAGTAGAHGDDDEMSPQEMKCMAKKYKKEHPKLCGTKSSGHAHAAKPVAIKHALKYRSDGIIDHRKVNLSGIPGVSRKDEKAAEKLLKATIKTLPRWSDPAVAAADGFKSIGDGLTGEEHMLHWDWIDDDVIFDPERPESLVYKVDRATGTKTLEAAMYILPKEYNLDNTPAIDSKLVQFHQHDNLCFTTGDAPRVAGLTQADGSCRAPLTKFNPNIQVHVWIRQNDCGPFASLLGVGAGQIKAGAKRSCVHSANRLGL
jgi:hypothetical protein